MNHLRATRGVVEEGESLPLLRIKLTCTCFLCSVPHADGDSRQRVSLLFIESGMNQIHQLAIQYFDYKSSFKPPSHFCTYVFLPPLNERIPLPPLRGLGRLLVATP